jgi:hypothetical protein
MTIATPQTFTGHRTGLFELLGYYLDPSSDSRRLAAGAWEDTAAARLFYSRQRAPTILYQLFIEHLRQVYLVGTQLPCIESKSIAPASTPSVLRAFNSPYHVKAV